MSLIDEALKRARLDAARQDAARQPGSQPGGQGFASPWAHMPQDRRSGPDLRRIATAGVVVVSLLIGAFGIALYLRSSHAMNDVVASRNAADGGLGVGTGPAVAPPAGEALPAPASGAGQRRGSVAGDPATPATTASTGRGGAAAGMSVGELAQAGAAAGSGSENAPGAVGRARRETVPSASLSSPAERASELDRDGRLPARDLGNRMNPANRTNLAAAPGAASASHAAPGDAAGKRAESGDRPERTAGGVTTAAGEETSAAPADASGSAGAAGSSGSGTPKAAAAAASGHSASGAGVRTAVDEGSYVGEVRLADGSAVKLSGIAYSEANPIAVINGKVLAPGQGVDDLTVSKIEADRVTLRHRSGIVFYLRLN